MITLQDLIDWCNAWLDDYYDLYEIEEDLSPQLVEAILAYLQELKRLKGVMNDDRPISYKM